MGKTKTMSVVLAIILSVAGVPGMRGVASATSVHGAVALNGVDIWQFQCTSPQTKCILAQVCDAVAGSLDKWVVTMDIYSPTMLFGNGDTAWAETGACGVVEVCRIPSSHGPIKAFVNINHVFGGDFDGYEMSGACLDADGNTLPNSTAKFMPKLNE